MKKDVPLTDNTLFSNGVLGDNLELLVLHQAYVDLTEDDEETEDEKNDKN